MVEKIFYRTFFFNYFFVEIVGNGEKRKNFLSQFFDGSCLRTNSSGFLNECFVEIFHTPMILETLLYFFDLFLAEGRVKVVVVKIYLGIRSSVIPGSSLKFPDSGQRRH